MRNLMKMILLFLTTLTLLIGSYSFAQTGEEAKATAAQKKEQVRQKAKEKAGMRFDQIDTDKDGKIGLDEWKAAHPDKPMAEERFTKADANADGFLTKEEMQGSAEKIRKRMKRTPKKQ